MPNSADMTAGPLRERADPCADLATVPLGAAPPMPICLSIPSPISSPISWTETRAALRADRAHWARRIPGPVRLRRGYQAVWLYRMSRYAHERGWRMAAVSSSQYSKMKRRRTAVMPGRWRIAHRTARG